MEWDWRKEHYVVFDEDDRPIGWYPTKEDAEIAFEKGEEIKMDIGIDGMRHVMRSMLHELRGKNSKYNFFKIDKTKHFDFSTLIKVKLKEL